MSVNECKEQKKNYILFYIIFIIYRGLDRKKIAINDIIAYLFYYFDYNHPPLYYSFKLLNIFTSITSKIQKSNTTL